MNPTKRHVAIALLVAAALLPSTSFAVQPTAIDQLNSAAAGVEALGAIGALSKGEAQSLGAQIDAAIAALERGNDTAAIAITSAIIRRIETMRDHGRLDPVYADALVELLQIS